jgi:hypothetical protein
MADPYRTVTDGSRINDSIGFTIDFLNKFKSACFKVNFYDQAGCQVFRLVADRWRRALMSALHKAKQIE